MTQLFYLIWRNNYIRRLIRNINCRGLCISVDNEYLKENHQYLSLFSDRDKRDYNISFRFDGSFQDYTESEYKGIVNVVCLRDSDLLSESAFDFNQLHQGVTILSFRTCLGKTGVGQLPTNLTFLDIDRYDQQNTAPIVHHMLSNLPGTLETLILDDHHLLTSTYVMPESLTNLYYESTYDNLKMLVVPPNKVYKDCILYVDSMEALQWLHHNTWINNINISFSLLTENAIPSHVRMESSTVKPEWVFPPMLQSLFCAWTSSISFSHLSHLKHLYLCTIPKKMDKYTLPRSLLELNMPLNLPLDHDVLPPHLTTLYLYSFNHPLTPGLLPNTLTDIRLEYFNQPLMPFVLPRGLKKLSMSSFAQPIIFENSLPASLVHLLIGNFTGSFELSCQPLDNLKRLEIASLVPSLPVVLKNVKRITILGRSINVASGGTCLANTSIESLHLYLQKRHILSPNTFPRTIKYLTLSNFAITTSDVIPDGCVYVKSVNQTIDPQHIPPSVKYFKLVSDINK
ncbi:hypothetical protein CYY_008360 [Polysphondylium violaceum]|uniref:FNIP repeat-containing protein n=1 Tax=Polysphondylium violaceum TaxID=133409 RepID=A0A8J4PN31_9MYCE|nr:hypothetical protein CYY_008360 [Polysphondylium violaceum]